MKDRERLWPNCRHCVFYLFKASLLHILVIFAVDSCHWLFNFVPTYLLIWMLLAEGFRATDFFLIIRLAFCGSFAVFATECWRFILFCVCLVCFFIRLSGLSSEFELLSITPFSHPDVSFPPAFHYVTTPVSAMHLGNQEMESDAEDEVNHTLPTMCCPLR